MDFAEKIDFIASRRRFGMKPGLERMEALAAALGNPERDLACVHVAGTNGKGSVAAMVAAVLQSAGFGKVGRYTSPHLVYFNERICIDGEPVADAVLEPALDKVLAAVRDLDAKGAGPTFFECVTALAFEVFRAEGVKLAVIETGLGGRLDATNVILPVLSVITNVGLEHCEYLGDTVAKIAFEKAGIVKAGRPVVTGAMEPEALAVIRARAAELGAPAPSIGVSVASRTSKAGDAKFSFEDEFRSVSGIAFPLSGAYQRENLATAVAALEVFSQSTGLPISDDAFKSGLEKVSWPCRFQKVSSAPDVIVDGAHNPPAAVALAETLSKMRVPLALVAGFCGDKDCLKVLRTLKPHFRRAWATETPSPRTSSAGDVQLLMRQAGFAEPGACPSWRDAVAAASAWAGEKDGAVIVCGSLFLAGAVADAFGALPWRGGAVIPSELLKPPASR